MAKKKEGKRESSLVTRWKEYTLTLVKRRFGDTISMTKVEQYLDDLIEREMVVPQVHWINNFRRGVANTDALAAIESIEENSFIVGGAATTFVQHSVMPNPMRDFILWLRKKRSAEKKERDVYERGTDQWERFNTKQGNTKVVSNSLYGVLGYAKFILHNIFLAEAITRMGRVIISTAACGFENFLADNIHFATSSELYEYINNIIDEYEEHYEKEYDFSILGAKVTVDQTLERLLNKCGFPIEASVKDHVRAILGRQSDDALLMLFYKNNFYEFNRIPLIKGKIMHITENVEELKLPSLDKIEDPAIRAEVEDLWNFYDTFVFYNRPIYDSVRKMAYGTREAVLYIDTDSNFIALNKWVQQIQHEFFQDNFHQDKKEFTFICANILTIFLTTVVDRNLKMYARNCGITDEWAKYLSMKNEFFFWRILFGDVKKRYIDLQMIQEGKLLNNGEGIPEIKGYDFRKSVTKEYVREFYTRLCMDEILSPDEVDLRKILHQVDWLKKEVKRSMEAGESMYFKQANVNSPEHYATPMRIAGIKAVMIWNALCPEYAIELPSDVDIIPIKNLSLKKNKEWLAQTWPELYVKLDKEIFSNRNTAISTMAVNVIAKPKNANVPIPEWLPSIMDTSKIVTSTIKLINPIMESLGMKIQKPTSTKEFLTNIVDL
jgi:hypothetical protein